MEEKVLLVSTGNYNLDSIDIVSTLENQNWGLIDCLIYHSSTDNKLNILLELPIIGKQVEKIIYINSKIDAMLFSVFKGLGADVYDDESYLEDLGILQFLIESYKSTGMTMKDPDEDMDKVAKNIDAITKLEPDEIKKLANNANWVKTLEDAVERVENALVLSSHVNTSVVEVLSSSKQLINTLQENQNNTTAELDKLKEMIDDMESKARPNTPFIYSTYTVPITIPKVLFIKCISPCKGLLSFLKGYQHYLKMLNISSKMVVAVPKLKLYMERYKHIPRLAPDSISLMSMSSDFFVTFEPKKQVIDAFFGQKADIYIFVDMMYGSDLLEGSKIESFYAVASPSDVKKFDLPVDRTISFASGYRSSIRITDFFKKNYIKLQASAKLAMYGEGCSEQYAIITDILNKRGRV